MLRFILFGFEVILRKKRYINTNIFSGIFKGVAKF